MSSALYRKKPFNFLKSTSWMDEKKAIEKTF